MMNMKKKMISLLLVLALVVGICPAAFAEEVGKELDETQVIRDNFLVEDGLDDPALQEVLEEYNALTDDEAEDYIVPFEIIDKYYTMTEAEQDALQAILDSLNEENVTSARAARSIVGPYLDIEAIPPMYLAIVLANLENRIGSLINADVTYNGKECYVFSGGSIDVYVAASAFRSLKDRSFPAAVSVSNTLTDYINSDNSKSVYTTRMTTRKSPTDIYLCTISQIWSQVSYDADNYLYLLTKYGGSIYLEAGYNYLTPYNVIGFSVQPEMKITMTNAGSANAFFGGLTVEGLGTSISQLEIGSLISLGYNTGAVLSGNFAVGTVLSILNSVFKLAKSQQGKDYKYGGSITQLSNVAENKYTRECKLKSPFKLARRENYFQMKIGIRNTGNDISKIKYKIEANYYFS